MPGSAVNWAETMSSNAPWSDRTMSKLQGGHGDAGRDVCGIILAGSQNWGDGRFEQVLRGPLLPLAHTPMICYGLEWLRLNGVNNVILCAGGATTAVRAFLRDGSDIGVHADYYEDVEPRGPAGCAHDAAQRSTATTFVVVEGSIIPSVDLAQLLEAHRTSGAVATVVVEVDRRTRPGASPEPPQPGGIYVFERRVLEGVPARGYQDIKQGLLDRLYASGEVVLTHDIEGITPRVLDFATYASVGSWLITEEIRHPRFLADYLRIGDGLHHPTATVHHTARIIGPVLLGPNVTVAAGAVVIGPTSIGHDSVIGPDAVVTRSSIWNDCIIEEGVSIDASLLADHVVVARGERVGSATCIPADTISPEVPERLPRVPRPAIAALFPPSPKKVAERPVLLAPRFVGDFTSFGDAAGLS